MAEKPRRIQLSRAKGWRMPANTVKVDRSTQWGNPFIENGEHDRAAAVYLYREWMLGRGPDPLVERPNPSELRGKNLACWCKPGTPCHAEVLLELANRDE